MAEHNELGDKGEFLAVQYLEKQGYSILTRNWRSGKLEIDIIAQKDGFVVFVEVKTRVNNYMGEPEMAVTKKKQSQIIKAADAYFKETDCQLESRFDIISVILNSKTEEIKHIEQAFYPLMRR
jgi:putative endonuclease